MMRRLLLYVVVLLTTALACHATARAQGQNKQTTPQSDNKAITANQTTPDGERVYAPKEVTKKASIKSRPAPDYYPGSQWGRITIVLRAVLRASGEVDPVKVHKISPENLPDDIVNGLTRSCVGAAQRIKFEPAMKDGQPVSQYILIEYHFN
jgi:hypothetical protein